MAKIISSYKARILQYNHIFDETVKICRKALSFLINAVANEWDDISQLKGKLRNNYVESLTHITALNPTVKYDFDSHFRKFPSYLRRAAIAEAIGIVSSYKSNYDNWVKDGKKTKEPQLQLSHCWNIPLYKKNMFYGDCFSQDVVIKLYHQNDWITMPFKLRKQDVKYLCKYYKDKDFSVPTLERHHNSYYLRFAFEEYQPLKETETQDQVVLAVDLGLNTYATCSVIDSKGTVYSRHFIDFGYEKDLLSHKLNRLKKFQKQHGSKNAKCQWSYITNLNTEISRKVAKEITNLATLYDVDAIIFEYLELKGKKKGSKKQKLSLWRKRDIQKLTEHKAHKNGIHIYRVNAFNTSKLAYDGSGPVIRDSDNYSLCTFTNGKRYNCDLSASYNIGARYFIREFLKPFSVTERSQVEAKVPELVRRTHCTLSTLISFNKVLEAFTVS